MFGLSVARRRRAVGVVRLTLLAAGLAFAAPLAARAQGFATPALSVATVVAEPQPWISTVPAIGLLESIRGVDVSASVDGLVKEVGFESGATVKAGQVLIQLDSAVEIANLKQAQAELPSAKAEYDRQADLARRGFAAQQTFQTAQAKYNSLVAQIASLQAVIERRVIVAPFDGVLGIRLVEKGQYLQPGTKIANLQDLSAMRVRFIVSQRDLARISVGQKLQVTVDAYPDQKFEGAIAAIEPQVDYQSGVVQVQAHIPNADSRLRPGMFAKLEIVLPEQKQAIALPTTAIAFNLYGETVYVVREKAGPDGKPGLFAERVSVTTGEQRGGMTVITSGVNPGDRVVTVGQLRLQNGSAVQLADDAGLPPRDKLPRY